MKKATIIALVICTAIAALSNCAPRFSRPSFCISYKKLLFKKNKNNKNTLINFIKLQSNNAVDLNELCYAARVVNESGLGLFAVYNMDYSHWAVMYFINNGENIIPLTSISYKNNDSKSIEEALISANNISQEYKDKIKDHMKKISK